MMHRNSRIENLVKCHFGGGGGSPPPPPPAPSRKDAATNVGKLDDGLSKKRGYQSTLLGGTSQQLASSPNMLKSILGS